VAELVKDVVLAGNLFQTLDRIDKHRRRLPLNQMGAVAARPASFPSPSLRGTARCIEEALVGGDVAP